MNIQDIRKKIGDVLVFKYADIFKWYPDANEQTVKQNLKYWIKKGWIERLKKGVYKFSDVKIKDEFVLAAFLDDGSYISLETALSFYNMLPEYPYEITSVTLGKTKRFRTKYGVFSFRHIKKELFFGFVQKQVEGGIVKIAEKEKALFDFLYLNSPEIKTVDYFEEMRLVLPKTFSFKKLLEWRQFLSPAKQKVIDLLLKYANK